MVCLSVILCGLFECLSGSGSVQVFCCLLIHVFPLEIHLSRENIGIPSTGLTRYNCVPVLSPDLDFKRHMSSSYFVFGMIVLLILVELLTITV